MHPDIVPRAKIAIVGDDLAFFSTARSVRNVTDSMRLALQSEQDSDPRLGGPDGFTFAAWVRRANYGSLTDTIFELGSYAEGGGGVDLISLTFGDGHLATAGRRLSSGAGPGLRYTVQNGANPQQASALEASHSFPPWVWVHVIVVHEADGLVSLYVDNQLVASGAVTLPTKVFRSSHLFGGALTSLVPGSTSGASTLFRGVLRDVFVTADAIDEHHRNHLQTHTGPSEG